MTHFSNIKDKKATKSQSNISPQEVQRLREQLALSELKVEMLETIIEEAEEMLQIDIKNSMVPISPNNA